MKSNFNKFQHFLRADQIQYIEYRTTELMAKFGYQPVEQALSANSLDSLQQKLLQEERHEKAEFQLVSAPEREQRQRWMTLFQKIQQRR